MASLSFNTKAEAQAYAEANNIAEVIEGPETAVVDGAEVLVKHDNIIPVGTAFQIVDDTAIAD